MREHRKNYIRAVNERCIERLADCSTWLDVGSGDGARVREILERTGDREVVCIEPSKAMAHLCADNVKKGEVLNRYLDQQFSENYGGQFECVTALWNVLGHFATGRDRREFINNVRNVLGSGGTLLLDVNNRHNGKAYGFIRSRFRYFRDLLWFCESSGDAVYSVKVGNRAELCCGHIFTTEELLDLFPADDWACLEVEYIDYQSGEAATDRFSGQILIRATAS